ncbi:MAG: hypothetical protein L0210_15680 [Rhodospirillales bacterium]|nr:hypothetical protein [Rhodospirillales bacterium]
MRIPPAPKLLLLSQALAAALIATPAKAEVLNLSEHSVCITATRAEQTFERRVDCGTDAVACDITEGYDTPNHFYLRLQVNELESEYIFVTLITPIGVVMRKPGPSPVTTTVDSLTSSDGFQAQMAKTGWAAWEGEYDGTAVFRLVPKGAACESPAAQPAAAPGAPAPGQSWSDWFWGWFQ